MRTTLDIEEDVLFAAKDLARRETVAAAQSLDFSRHREGALSLIRRPGQLGRKRLRPFAPSIRRQHR